MRLKALASTILLPLLLHSQEAMEPVAQKPENTQLLATEQVIQTKAAIPTIAPECREQLTAAKKKHAELDDDSMLRFYGENAPDLLGEWEKRCKASAERGTEYTEMLVRHFLEIDKFRESKPEEYERLVKQQRSESMIRVTSMEIQEAARQENGKERLRELKLKLKKLMEDSFDEAQRRQMLEINRLENEVRNLRNIAEQRAANRQSILRQRFMLLTGGQEWPK